jgi:hypothetical protein
MKHRQTPYNFKLEVLPLSGGTFSALVRSQYVDVGTLFDTYIAPALYSTPKVFSAREPFTLVNVTCTHAGVSFGYLETPPKEAQPLACTWLFTFAISDEQYTHLSKVGYTSLRWINTRVWGQKSSKFITIGIPHTQSQYLGLKYDSLTPRIVYFLIGCISKSFVRQHKYWNPNITDYEGSYKAFNLPMVHSGFYMQPMYNFMSRTPYHLWVFNRHIWLSAPNMLSAKHITPTTMLYILMYIRVDNGMLTKVVEDKVLDYLENSLLSTLQRTQQEIAPSGFEDCLYTALMYRDEIPENHTLEWLTAKEKSVMEFGLDNVTDYRDYVRTQFYA